MKVSLPRNSSLFFLFLAIIFLWGVLSCSPSNTGLHESESPIDFIVAIAKDTTQSGVFKSGAVISKRSNDMGSFMQRYDSATEAFVKFDTEISYMAALLVESDTTYIRSQLKGRQNFKLDSLAGFGLQLINVDSLYKTLPADSVWGYITTQIADGYYVVGMPIFNRTRDRVYIKISFLCGGHCGSGYEAIFEKRKSKWVLRERMGDWVS